MIKWEMRFAYMLLTNKTQINTGWEGEKIKGQTVRTSVYVTRASLASHVGVAVIVGGLAILITYVVQSVATSSVTLALRWTDTCRACSLARFSGLQEYICCLQFHLRPHHANPHALR